MRLSVSLSVGALAVNAVQPLLQIVDGDNALEFQSASTQLAAPGGSGFFVFAPNWIDVNGLTIGTGQFSGAYIPPDLIILPQSNLIVNLNNPVAPGSGSSTVFGAVTLDIEPLEFEEWEWKS
jgi:hypothetical protein